jgi:hypothetical protein
MNLGSGGGSGMGQPKIDMKQTKPIVCDCGNYTFTTAVFLREVSALVSPNGQAGVVPISTVVCNACGRVPDKMIPPFLREEASGESPVEEPTSPLVSGESPTPTMQKSKLTLL